MVDRSWFKYRTPSGKVNPAGGIDRPAHISKSENIRIPTDQEGFEQYLVDRALMLENTFNCATIKFSWEDTKEYVQYGPIACYRCSWKWDGFPDYYANHQDELYFVFLDMEGLTTEFLADVFGMSGYRRGKGRQGIDTISVKQIVSKIPIHLTEDNKFFRVAPDPIMGTVATAIGLGDVLISTVRSEKSEG
tara:strand:- start:249 stop:821 length:573 start_codon:yes stop_codon:yes gene_type:complete